MRIFTILMSFLALAAAPLHAQPVIQPQGSAGPGHSAVISTDTVHSQLTSSHLTITPGSSVQIAWEIKLDPHWHVYWSNPGDSGLTPTLTATGFTAPSNSLVFPVPHVISVPPITNYGYEDHLILIKTVTAPATLPTGPLALPIRLTYLYCSDVCMPGQVSLTLPLEVGNQAVINPAFAPLQQAQAPQLPHPLASGTTKAVLTGKTIQLSLNPSAFGGTISSAHFIPSSDGWLHDSAPQPFAANALTLALDPYQTKSVTAVEGLLIVNGQGYSFSTPLVKPDGAPATASLPAPTNTAAADPATASPIPAPTSDVPTDVSGAATPPTGPLMAAVLPPGAPPAPVSSMPLTLPLALFFALVAGLVLNVMPCVLPVLSFKLLSLVRQPDAASRRRHSLFYTLGVLLGFWSFAGLILLFQQGGEKLGWGFHLQNPLFVAALIGLMLAIALNLFGVFEVGAHLTRLAGRPHVPTESTAGSVINDLLVGLLAVVVATPCTVPFMGGAVAYALAQPPLPALLVFTALGLGMALPFLLAGIAPGLLGWLPKPGRWMLTFKHLLAWPMLATALWLLWVFANQTSFSATFLLLMLLLALAFTLWLYGLAPRRLTGLLSAAPLALAVWLLPPLIAMTTPGSPSSQHAEALWQPWSPAAQTAALATGNPVFVDITADWCLTCKVTEATVLNTRRVQKMFTANHVVLLQADWTRQDATITTELAAHGRRGVPLYLAYLPGKTEPVILPQLLTPGLLTDTFSPAKP